MANTKRNSKISPVPKPQPKDISQLPCRATPRDAALIRKAAELDSRRSVNSFIIGAAVAVALEKIASHGLSEADVLAELADGARKTA